MSTQRREGSSSARVKRAVSQAPPKTPTQLAEHEPDDDADEQGIGQSVRERRELDRDPGGQEREDRHGEAGRERSDAVLEPLRRGVVLVGVGLHPGQQAEGDAGNGGVDPGLVHERPDDQRQRHVDPRR